MSDVNVILRPAELADAGFLAWGLDEAAGGLFATMLGTRAHQVLTDLMAMPRHEFSYEHAVVAEVAGASQGFCQGWPAGTPSASRAYVHAAGILTVRSALVALAGWPVFDGLRRHAPGEWYLQAIAVKASARGAGIGGLLLREAFQRAVQSDCSTITLDVDAANDRARKLYEGVGFRVVRTSRRAVLLGGVREHRMSAVLRTS